MRITLLGAAGGEVTGSAYLVETASAAVLVDCGFFQGAKKLENYNRLPTRGAITRLNAVVLTHAHLDHTGRLPLLTKGDYRGPIYGTPETFDLADLILRDSASLQKSDVERENRRRRAAGRPPLEQLFTAPDVTRLRPLYKRIAYNSPTEVAPDIVVRLVDAGHILGSSSIEMTVREDGRSRVVVFGPIARWSRGRRSTTLFSNRAAAQSRRPGARRRCDDRLVRREDDARSEALRPRGILPAFRTCSRPARS